jgi:hypothetical protein
MSKDAVLQFIDSEVSLSPAKEEKLNEILKNFTYGLVKAGN